MRPITIQVSLGKISYPIWIKNNLIDDLDELLKPINKGQIFTIISQPIVYQLYGKNLILKLKERKFNVKNLLIEENESAKSISHAEICWKKLIQLGCDRHSTLIALGGGVTGDLTGFLASTLFRGIEYIQIPTTLLSMVDSSIGGKTGINLQDGKNLIGTFYQPNSVIIDPQFLISLPENEIISGIGEIIKYGAIKNPQILLKINNWCKNEKPIDNKVFTELIHFSCKIKADIVGLDEKENDIRKILNFGHTFGHALESTTQFNYFTHGEAVLHGIKFAIQLSLDIFKLEKEQFEVLINCIKLLNIKILPKLDSSNLFKFMMNDKKRINNKINFILLKKLGKPIISNDVPNSLVKKHINKYLKDNS